MAKKKVAKKKKAAKKKTSRKPAKIDNYCVGSKIKAAVKAKGCNFGGDSLDALNMVIHWYIEQGTARAKANGRKTVRAHDFLAM
jgi:hypothetical protein